MIGDCELIRVNVLFDENEYGEMAYLVCPVYRCGGHTMSIPDTKGWPTLEEAFEFIEAEYGLARVAKPGRMPVVCC